MSHVPIEAARPAASVFVRDPGLSRFAFVLLCYVLGLAVLATLSPFDFDLRHPHGYVWDTTASDVALNLAFLFPVGFLLGLTRAQRAWKLGFDALALGLVVSIALELLQLFLPSRVTSPTDVLTNGLGAWAGGIAHARIGPYLDRRLQRQLSLHLPLANLLYLSVPLLSLDALVARHWHGCLPELPLAVFIAVIAAGLYKHRIEGAAAPFPNRFACTIGLFFGIGYMPIVVGSFELWACSVLVMAVLTRLAIAFGTHLPAAERRFVPITLRRALPWFLLYILLLGAHRWLFGSWGQHGSLRHAVITGGQVAALALLRDVAAFTLLGYLGSELHARSSASTLRILGRAMVLAIPAAVFFAELRCERTQLVTVNCLGFLCAGALAGALIHRAQLRLVRSWSRNTERPRA